MGFFDVITNPIRGIGRILRGHVKSGLHDITDSASKLAPAAAWIPGVGPLAAGALGGLGKLGEDLTDRDKGVDVLGVLGGAAGGYGSGKLAEAVGGVSGVKGGINKLLGLGGGGAPAGAAASTAASAAAPAAAASTVAPAAQKQGMDALTKIALGSNIAGSAANAYGAHQMGKAEDRRVSLEEEELARQRERQESLDPMRGQLLAMLMKSLQGTSARA